jgi:hypothetical protein
VAEAAVANADSAQIACAQGAGLGQRGKHAPEGLAYIV